MSEAQALGLVVFSACGVGDGTSYGLCSWKNTSVLAVSVDLDQGLYAHISEGKVKPRTVEET